MGLFLGIGVVAGFISTVVGLLITLLPYIILAAFIAEKDKDRE